jgi:hypothetical protein
MLFHVFYTGSPPTLATTPSSCLTCESNATPAAQADYLPVHTGLRFSPNAFNPSLASSVMARIAIWLSV